MKVVGLIVLGVCGLGLLGAVVWGLFEIARDAWEERRDEREDELAQERAELARGERPNDGGP